MQTRPRAVRELIARACLRAADLCYGRSPRVEATMRLRAPTGIIGSAAPRSYGSLAMQELSREEEPNAGLQLSLPQPSAEPAAAPPAKPAPEAPSPPEPPQTSAPKVQSKMNLHRLQLKYERGEPISMVTAYDYPSARLVDGAGMDMVLVGDSVAMVVLGQDDTTAVTMDQM
eukprot:1718631-Prymnesium_polylepis.1